MKLTLGYSPCPNDTFIFDAMVHGKIDTEGLDFEVQLGDVEWLNQRAFAGELDITKLSYHAYAYLMDTYVLLHAGSALGNNCGPLLISKERLSANAVDAQSIAIPGRFTTANFLLGWAFPQATNKREMLFSDIEAAVLSGDTALGLIIHENRFTYAAKGLHKVIDLGEKWEQETGLPIPLGGIVAKRNLDPELLRTINRVMARSVAYALDHPAQTLPYVRCHAQEMDDAVMMQHIELYVNDFTRDLGEKGRRAIAHLFETARAQGTVPSSDKPLFVAA